MFTGLIEAVCTVKEVRRSGDTIELKIDLANLAAGTKAGDSIAVNGTCLTVTKLQGSVASFDISGETLTKSTIGKIRPGAQVNAERALRPTDRLGGHFVQGHIDGVAKIVSIEKKGKFAAIKFAAVAQLLDQMIIKGSVAVDGISLTVADIDNVGFGVAVIPETLANTTLGKAKPGDNVNIETDIITKTIKKQLENMLGQNRYPKEVLTIEKLKEF